MEGKQHRFFKEIIQINLARKGYMVYPEVYGQYVNGTLDVMGAKIIGYFSGKVETIGIEVKTSRADFFGRKQKAVGAKGESKFNEKELGANFRYFFVPSGLVQKHELYDGWGLLEFKNRRVIKVVDAPRKEADNVRTLYWMAKVPYNLYHQEKTGLMAGFSFINYGDLGEA